MTGRCCPGGTGVAGMTPDGEHAVAGILDAVLELQGVLCGSVVSGLRMLPGQWAGAHVCWGVENREAAIRLVRADTEGDTSALLRKRIPPRECGGARRQRRGEDHRPVRERLLRHRRHPGCGAAGIERKATLPPEVGVDPPGHVLPASAHCCPPSRATSSTGWRCLRCCAGFWEIPRSMLSWRSAGTRSSISPTTHPRRSPRGSGWPGVCDGRGWARGGRRLPVARVSVWRSTHSTTANPFWAATPTYTPDAVVIGAVTLGDGVSVWPGAVLRGDYGTITIGERSNIQDGTVIHCTVFEPTVIGARCIVGHNAHIEGATIGDDCLIASGSVVLNGSTVGNGAIVGGRRRRPVQVRRAVASHGTRRARSSAGELRGPPRGAHGTQQRDVLPERQVLPRIAAATRLTHMTAPTEPMGRPE